MNYPQSPLPTLGRMMVFIDGENLVGRYQDMVGKGATPSGKVVLKDVVVENRKNDIIYEPDVFVWKSTTIQPDLNVVIRATYYTYVTGDDQRKSEVEARIKELDFKQYDPPAPYWLYPGLLNKLHPIVFKKLKKQKKTKGVDIQMTVDILSNLYKDTMDVAYLVAGDGDYLPVIQEVMRNGKQLFLAALSEGLSPFLRNVADKFIDLDSIYFTK